nr:4792_t:CDS:2 [Entrophospora candida]
MNIITSFNASLNGILSEILSELADESNYYDDSLSEIRQSNKMIRSLKQIIDTLNIIEACNNSKDGCKERLLKKKEYKTYKMLIDELAEVSADKLNERLIELDDKLNYKVVCHKFQSAEKNREEIINSEKYLLQIKNYKQHPEAFYTSRPISNLIQQAHDLSNLRVRQGATINYNFSSNVVFTNN